MSFELCNSPTMFMMMMNEIFSDLLDHGVVSYLDDILIYSKMVKEHDQPLKLVVQRLREKSLCKAV